MKLGKVVVNGVETELAAVQTLGVGGGCFLTMELANGDTISLSPRAAHSIHHGPFGRRADVPTDEGLTWPPDVRVVPADAESAKVLAGLSPDSRRALEGVAEVARKIVARNGHQKSSLAKSRAFGKALREGRLKDAGALIYTA